MKSTQKELILIGSKGIIRSLNIFNWYNNDIARNDKEGDMREKATEPLTKECRICHKPLLCGFVSPSLAEAISESSCTIIDCYAIGEHNLCPNCDSLPPSEICRLLRDN